MNNKVLVSCTGSATSTNFTTIAKLAIFAEDINTSQGILGVANDAQQITFDMRYIPNGVNILSFAGGLEAYTPVFFTKRQDFKTVELKELPKAVEGQGVAVLESVEGEYKKNFTSSWSFPYDDAYIRVGISNFTQSEDNNPYSDELSVIYFEI